ncbi:MAG: transcriptional regulator [Spirochaetales bacterium]|nr:transcriptional regulator [Spirochaetales bacterium]
MRKRSYHQFCPVAYALDVVGDRWTLLIVRELRYGPRRFIDVFRGLPGIGTNLLSDRFRCMTQEGIIERAKSAPPYSGYTYRLTDDGAGLQDVIDALAFWGRSRLSSVDINDHLGFVPAMGALSLLYHADDAEMNGTSCEIRTEEGVFHFTLGHSGINVAPGKADDPELIVDTEPRTFVLLLGRPDEAHLAEERGVLRIVQGGIGRLESLLEKFRPAV